MKFEKIKMINEIILDFIILQTFNLVTKYTKIII